MKRYHNRFARFISQSESHLIDFTIEINVSQVHDGSNMSAPAFFRSTVLQKRSMDSTGFCELRFFIIFEVNPKEK